MRGILEFFSRLSKKAQTAENKRTKEICRFYKLAREKKAHSFSLLSYYKEKIRMMMRILNKIFCFPPICSLPCVKPNGNRSILHDGKISTYTIRFSFSPTKLQFYRGPPKKRRREQIDEICTLF